MADRKLVSEEFLDEVVGGNLTYTWYGGKGSCGLNGNNKYHFSNKDSFESTMNDCFQNKGMSDVDTLKYMLDKGIIWR